VDLVGGKITLGNSGKISCEYKSNKLGNELKNLWDNEDFERARFFVDLTQNIKVADAALPAPPPQAPRPPPPPPMGGGGWFTRRRRAPLKLI
jgi:hypothetical protein